ncbi:MAG: DUF192 domain-containing protein [Candidatus Nomurabacteria bacterium]|nr:DUF192 domain-containing protein [Candidatus Nomurabacteria bacterium]
MSIKNVLIFTFILGALVIGTFLVVLKFDTRGNPATNISILPDYNRKISIAGIPLRVEFADTKEAQALGLSFRTPLKEDEGMLFVFDRPNTYKFWMKDMNFAIDMIWLDVNKKIVYIERNATPESYPKLFGPDQDAKYVLEVIAGFSAKHNLKIGDSLDLN